MRKREKHPTCSLFKEQDVILRALRDYLSPDIDEVVLDSDDAFDRAADYMRMVMPRQRGVLSRYVENRPIFHHWGIEDQLDTIFRPKVPMESGGSLVIEPTEALVSIDVNSGKQKAGGHEETAFATNLEAAEEVARQLRLRDLGGIIVCDFIDMNHRSNQQKVERAMKAALRKDRAKVKVSRISRNGTLELTCQRVRTSVQASVFRRCPTCTGTGWVMNPESHSIAVLRKVMDRAAKADLKSAKVEIEWEAGELLRTTKWSAVQELEKRYSIRIEVQQSRALLPGQVSFTFETNPDAAPLELEPPNFGPTPKFDIPEDELDGDDWDVSDLLKDEHAPEPEDDELEDEETNEEGEEAEDEEASDAEPKSKRGRRGRRTRRKGGKGRGEEADKTSSRRQRLRMARFSTSPVTSSLHRTSLALFQMKKRPRKNLTTAKLNRTKRLAAISVPDAIVVDVVVAAVARNHRQMSSSLKKRRLSLLKLTKRQYQLRRPRLSRQRKRSQESSPGFSAFLG